MSETYFLARNRRLELLYSGCAFVYGISCMEQRHSICTLTPSLSLTRQEHTLRLHNQRMKQWKKERKKKTEKLCRVTLSSNIFPSDNESIQFTTERKSRRAVRSQHHVGLLFEEFCAFFFTLATTATRDAIEREPKSEYSSLYLCKARCVAGSVASVFSVWTFGRFCASCSIWRRAENGNKSASETKTTTAAVPAACTNQSGCIFIYFAAHFITLQQ